MLAGIFENARFLNGNSDLFLGCFGGGSAKIARDSKCPIVKAKMVGKTGPTVNADLPTALLDCTDVQRTQFLSSFQNTVNVYFTLLASWQPVTLSHGTTTILSLYGFRKVSTATIAL